MLLSALAFARAGLADEAVRFLEELAGCAVVECRFNDASWYYWKLSRQCAEAAKLADGNTFVFSFLNVFNSGIDGATKRSYLKKFEDFSRRADIYYVYNNIHCYMVCLILV